MAGTQSFPDTIFDPTSADFQLTETSDSISGARLMSVGSHVDGLLFATAYDCGPNSTNLVLTRNGVGDWSYNRTAAGAETYYVRAALSDMAIIRTGESYNLSLFPGTNVTTAPKAPPKGIKIIDMFAVWNVGVVALTSATLRFGKSVYPAAGAASAAIVQTDIQAATALGSLATVTAGQYLTQKVAIGSPVFSVDDFVLLEVECNFVMANTGTIKFAGLGVHCYFNYN